MKPRLVSLFAGYGGLDLAITEVLDAETVAVADVCKVNEDGSVGHHEPHRAPCSILAHRFPDAPNLGDVSSIDWTPWRGRIEIIAAGFPCQDVSVAGNRAGLRDGTRTGLWSQVVRAITELQPRLVVLENVPGIFTASAAGDVEPCSWCVGDDPAGHLRALDAVLADLAALGFDADWTVVPASGVGAPHRRERWFAIAYPSGGQLARPVVKRDGLPVTGQRAGEPAVSLLPTPAAQRSGRNQSASPGAAVRWGLDYIDRLLPTPRVAGRGDGAAERRRNSPNLEATIAMLPTPRATDGTKGGPNQRGSSGDLMLPSAVQLLPTPTATDSKASGASGYDSGHAGTTLTDATIRQPDRWGEYATAIHRWESLTRPAPEPTKPNTKGNPKLSDEFDEWLMGLTKGWITDVPGITWNEALKACGNGVVWQQAAAALRWLLRAARWQVAA